MKMMMSCYKGNVKNTYRWIVISVGKDDLSVSPKEGASTDSIIICMRVSCRPQRSKENVGPAGLPDMMMNVNAVSLFINIQISFLFLSLSLSHSFKYLYSWKNGRQTDVTYIHGV